MSITNESKPTTGVPQTELDIGGFNLLIDTVYKLIIGPANTTAGMTNTEKVSIGETWATITTSWDTETRTWVEVSQLFNNVSITANIWAPRSLPWITTAPWLLTSNSITNQNKP